MLSFEENNDINNHNKRVELLFAKYYDKLTTLSAEEAHYLNHCALVSNIGASTRIENAVLTDPEVEWMNSTLSGDEKTTGFDNNREFILNKLSKDKQHSIEEVAGCRELLINVYTQYDRLFPLRESDLRELHKILLRHYSKASNYAGSYKTIMNKVVSRNFHTGEEKTVLQPAAPGPINEAAMSELISWYNDIQQKSDLGFLIATEFVFRFLAIHPFQDGNGRLGRALFILTLLQSKNPYIAAAAPYIAIDRHIERNKTLYYSSLRSCSEGEYLSDPTLYNYKPIIMFFNKVLEDSINDIDLYRDKFQKLQELTETEKKVLDLFKYHPEKQLQTKFLAEEGSLNEKTINRAVKKLCELNFLQKRSRGPDTRYQLVF